MAILVRPETESRLQQEAEHSGEDVDTLLNALLDNRQQEREEEVAAVRRGLADVAAGRTRLFVEVFAGYDRSLKAPPGRPAASAAPRGETMARHCTV